MTQVVAVADHTRRQARLAKGLCAAAEVAGCGLELRTHRELVAEVTIDQSSAGPPTVEPDRPLLWLSPGDGGRTVSRDDRFLGSEAYAAARSIALLTSAPVLNRPSARSACGTFPAGAASAVRRARHHDPEAVVRAERFTARWSADEEDTALEVHDYATGRSSFGRAPDSSGPFRCRTAVDGADLAKVTVVGDGTVAATHVGSETRAASCRVASGYGLDLATVWWFVDEDGAARTLARIDCWPLDFAFGGELEEVAAAAVVWVGERLGAPVAAPR